MNNSFAAFIEEGDEVIVVEPVFEFYCAQAQVFGAKLRFFPLDSPKEGSDEWTMDFEKLETYFNEKTRIILLNTPQNPTGKILKRDEIEKVVKILEKFPRVIVLSDEVIHNYNLF